MQQEFGRSPRRSPSYDSEDDRFRSIGRPPQLTRITLDPPPRWQVPMKVGSYEEDSDDEADDFRPTLHRQNSYNQNRRSHHPQYENTSSFQGYHDHQDAIPDQPRSHSSQQYSPAPPTKRRSSRRQSSRGPDTMRHDCLSRRPSLQRHSSIRSVNHGGEFQTYNPSVASHTRPPHQPQRKKSINGAQRQVRRTSSMPMNSSRNLSTSNSIQCRPARRQSIQVSSSSTNRTGETRNSKPGGKNFSPKRSKSIHRSFHKHRSMSEEENDIWVERIVLGGSDGPKTYFKSLYSGETRIEPPTGAQTIIYLEDMIERKKEKQEKPNSSKVKKQAQEKSMKSKKQSNTTATELKPKRRGSIFGMFKKSGKK